MTAASDSALEALAPGNAACGEKRSPARFRALLQSPGREVAGFEAGEEESPSLVSADVAADPQGPRRAALADRSRRRPPGPPRRQLVGTSRFRCSSQF